MSTEADAVAKLAKLADGNIPASDFETKDGRHFVITRNDFAIKDVTPANKAEIFLPKVVNETVVIQTAESLIGYTSRFKNRDSIIIADIQGNRITTIFDYHEAPEINRHGEEGVVASTPAHELPKPRLGAHRARLDLAFSQEWAIWTRVNERMMSHIEFANFLEENAIDVQYPAGSDLLEMVRDLHVRQNSHFTSSVRMGDTVKFEYKKDADATVKDTMEFPISFEVSIPVYFGELPVTLRAMTRRKIDDGELQLGFKLLQVEQTRQREFQRIVADIEHHTRVQAIYGQAKQ